MNRLLTTFLAGILLLTISINGCGTESGAKDKKTETTSMQNKSDSTEINYREIPFKTITGEQTSLDDFRGKVLLIVNAASECGFTPQYAGLEKLYQTYKNDGLVVIGFPANNFGQQEPGTDEEILSFCQTKFGVTFPMMSKVSVLGEDKHPLFKYLTEDSNIPGEIKWNFSKFLLDRDGNLVERFVSKDEPMSDKVVQKIKGLL